MYTLPRRRVCASEFSGLANGSAGDVGQTVGRWGRHYLAFQHCMGRGVNYSGPVVALIPEMLSLSSSSCPVTPLMNRRRGPLAVAWGSQLPRKTTMGQEAVLHRQCLPSASPPTQKPAPRASVVLLRHKFTREYQRRVVCGVEPVRCVKNMLLETPSGYELVNVVPLRFGSKPSTAAKVIHGHSRG